MMDTPFGHSLYGEVMRLRFKHSGVASLRSKKYKSLTADLSGTLQVAQTCRRVGVVLMRRSKNILWISVVRTTALYALIT